MGKRRLGIFLRRSSAEASFVQPRRRRPARIISQASARAEASLWQAGHAELSAMFRQLSRALPSDARRADVEHRIALPDPLVNEDRLVFTELPKDPDEARELILWRVAREHRKPPETLACAWQVEKEQDDAVDVLVRIADRAILDAVSDAAQAVGIFPTRIDSWSGFALARQGVTAAPAGARLWANEEWWALMCWARRDTEASDGETLVHSEWRDPAGSAEAMAEKVTRLARSFALTTGAEQLPLDLDTPEGLADGLREALESHAVLLPSSDTDFIRLGGADTVALDTA